MIYKNKFALLIGINYKKVNNYTSNISNLNGCCQDVDNMCKLIKNNGFKENEIKRLRDETYNKRLDGSLDTTIPTRQNMENEMIKLVNKKEYYMYMHYAGHGSQIRDYSGDEEDGMDECLIPYSGKYFTDDELSKIFSNLDKSSRLDITFDCCHSGTMLDLPYNWTFNESNELTINKINNTNYQNSGEILVISGCKDNQTAKEFIDKDYKNWKNIEGALTGTLRRILKRNSNISVYNLLRKINKNLKEEKLDQIVCLSSNKNFTIKELKTRKFCNFIFN